MYTNLPLEGPSLEVARHAVSQGGTKVERDYVDDGVAARLGVVGDAGPCAQGVHHHHHARQCPVEREVAESREDARGGPCAR